MCLHNCIRWLNMCTHHIYTKTCIYDIWIYLICLQCLSCSILILNTWWFINLRLSLFACLLTVSWRFVHDVHVPVCLTRSEGCHECNDTPSDLFAVIYVSYCQLSMKHPILKNRGTGKSLKTVLLYSIVPGTSARVSHGWQGGMVT